MIEKLNLGNSIDIGGHNINGEWIKSNTRLWNGTMTANQVTTHSLANILPNDGYDYEVQICDWLNTDSTSGHELKIFVYPTTSASGNRICIDRVRTCTASSESSASNAIIPISANDKNITIQNATSYAGGNCGFYVLAYRRIGTNGVIPQTYYNLTINPTPSDATVTFNKGTVEGNTCTAVEGTVVTYTVSKSGYVTKSANATVNSNQTINVELTEIPYSVDEIIFESSTAGSYSINLAVDGKYEVICIAGGGGGYSSVPAGGGDYLYYGGGSGSGFDCVLRLTAGNYTAVVGAGGIKQGGASAGNSQFGTSYAYKGGNAQKNVDQNEGKGAAGGSPTVTYTVVSTNFNRAGNGGTWDKDSQAAGGYSVYNNTATGYGAGGRSNQNGYVGYVKVIYKGV